VSLDGLSRGTLRHFKNLVVASLLLLTSATAQNATADRALLSTLNARASRFASDVRAQGINIPLPVPAIRIDQDAQVARYDNEKNVVHMLRWDTASMRARATFNLMAIYCKDGTTGKSLFSESYDRLFFTHELAHWLQLQFRNQSADHYALELEANRMAVAYWSQRPNDRIWLGRLVERYRKILTQLPSPVPNGQRPSDYFNKNYAAWVDNGKLEYGTSQLTMVVQAWDDRDRPTFAEMIHSLAKPSGTSR
jgi:hypothetical protein